jgi:hypothetical protein
MPNQITYTTNQTLTDLLKVVLPEYEIKSAYIINSDGEMQPFNTEYFGPKSTYRPLITLHTLIDLLAGDKPKILNKPSAIYETDDKYLQLIQTKTIAQFFLREDIESGRVLTDFEGVCLELIEIIKVNYNLK